jgi:hypothetical protein
MGFIFLHFLKLNLQHNNYLLVLAQVNFGVSHEHKEIPQDFSCITYAFHGLFSTDPIVSCVARRHDYSFSATAPHVYLWTILTSSRFPQANLERLT